MDEAKRIKIIDVHKRLNEARDKYLELRDAKSNGCCHGMTILQVMAYDRKITDAYKEVEKLLQEEKELLQGGE